VSNTKSPDSAGDPSVDGHAVDADEQGEDEATPDSSASGTDGRGAERVGTNWLGLRLVAIVGTVVLILDQVTKIWAVSALADRDIDLFWTARLNLTYNFGSAFGLGSQLGRWLGVLVIGVVVAVLLYARQVTDRRMLVLFGALAGGAIGNIVDRIARAKDGFLSGGVVDFIDFQWWPIFNVADIAVVCSAIGLMLLSFREPDLT